MIFRFLFLISFFSIRLNAQVVISEFMASNQATLADEDGDFSDWIELENTGSAPVDLTGWFLTDDSGFDVNDPESVWALPARVVAPGESIVVFASGKDRRPSAGEWHTNFQLASSGEYLALIQANGVTVASEFSPAYPEQEVDISYGRGAVSLATLEFLKDGDSGKVLIPADGSEGTLWTGGNEPFADSTWNEVKTGTGFDSGSGPSGFALVENFEALNTGPLDGQGGWSTSSASVAVAIDPSDAENQVMNQTGNGLRAWKAMEIPNGSTGTVFYRMRRDGGVNISIGTSDQAVPGTAFSEFEAQMNNQGDDVLKVRDGGGFTDVDQFADGTWYEVWMVVDNSADTYQVYLKGGALSERTLLDAGAQTDFGFRNGSAASAMETFFARTGNGQSGTWLIDDIYLAEGENLGNPASGLGLGDFIHDEGDLESVMSGVSSSAYLRIPFDLDDSSEVSSLTLRMRYDDGFVAYLNGTEIASRNAPASPDWQSASSSERPGQEASIFEEIDVTDFAHLLVPNSTNILAIHGLNVSASDGDFLISPELVGVASSASVEMLYFSAPTPGESNGSGFLGFVGDTRFSIDRGFYHAPIEVVIDSETEGSSIIYTTDGSEPDANNGTLVTAPATVSISTTTPLRAVAVKDGFRASNVDTHTYIFPSDVIMQGNSPAGYPSTWKGDNGNGSETADYGMDPEITQSAEYASLMDDALMAIPTISLVTDKDHLFAPATGIYQNPQQKGSAWERPVSFEIIHPDGERSGIQVDAGIRIQGGHTRLPSKNPKHSFRLSFKRDFGPAKLNYDLFPDDPDAAKEFDQLILRGAGNQSWLHHNTFKGDNRGRAQYIRDQWAKDVQLAMGHSATRSLYAHLY
ncbi:lamin tail domain-containing protein, partial [Akkermansiaceae bacterium]|nr:lamin tail domain-containing protein [Akkermansiaceae bacterium]